MKASHPLCSIVGIYGGTYISKASLDAQERQHLHNCRDDRDGATARKVRAYIESHPAWSLSKQATSLLGW